MAAEVIRGIDFGTSCTSGGALIGDRVELIQDNGDVVIPSVVYVPDRGPLEIGRRAQMRMLTDSARAYPATSHIRAMPPLHRRSRWCGSDHPRRVAIVPVTSRRGRDARARA